MPKLTLKFFKNFILSLLTSVVFMNYLFYIIYSKLSFYEFGSFLAVISLIGLIFLSAEVNNKKSAVPFAVSLLLYILLLVYRQFPNIFPTDDCFIVVEYILFSASMISASIFLYKSAEICKQAVAGFLVFVQLYSILVLVPSIYDVLFTEHHLVRESLLLFYGLFQLIGTIFGIFYASVWIVYWWTRS